MRELVVAALRRWVSIALLTMLRPVSHPCNAHLRCELCGGVGTPRVLVQIEQELAAPPHRLRALTHQIHRCSPANIVRPSGHAPQADIARGGVAGSLCRLLPPLPPLRLLRS